MLRFDSRSTEQVTSPAAKIRQAQEGAGEAVRALQQRLDALFLRHEGFGGRKRARLRGTGGRLRRHAEAAAQHDVEYRDPGLDVGQRTQLDPVAQIPDQREVRRRCRQADAAQFVQELKTHLEQPATLFVE